MKFPVYKDICTGFITEYYPTHIKKETSQGNINRKILKYTKKILRNGTFKK
jgi:hypothetical protein